MTLCIYTVFLNSKAVSSLCQSRQIGPNDVPIWTEVIEFEMFAHSTTTQTIGKVWTCIKQTDLNLKRNILIVIQLNIVKLVYFIQLHVLCYYLECVIILGELSLYIKYIVATQTKKTYDTTRQPIHPAKQWNNHNDNLISWVNDDVRIDKHS